MPRGQGRGRRGGRGQRGAAEETQQPRETSAAAREGNQSAYDGPSENRGRSPSNPGPSRTVRTTSRNRSTSRNPPVQNLPAQQGKQRRDPARDPPKRELLRNVDFGGSAYNILGGMPGEVMPRPGFGKLGKAALVNVNSYQVMEFPTKIIYQYDVQIGSGEEKRGLVRVAAESAAFKKAVGPGFIFDGAKIGWSTFQHPQEIRVLIDLDAAKGQPPREGRDNTTRLKVTLSKKINLHVMSEYLAGRMKFDGDILVCINFLDHLLRETPSKTHINLRRSYFSKHPAPEDIYNVGFGVEAIKGVYQSLRVAEGNKLVINVDVSNSCFWNKINIAMIAQFMSTETDRTRFLSISQMKNDRPPPLWKEFRRLIKNKFIVKPHSENDLKRSEREYTITNISHLHAKNYTFDVKNRETGATTKTTLWDYYKTKYGIYIQNHHLPLIETQKPGTLFPMELCIMCPGQRFPYKLNDVQTSAMIKFAVSRPPQRRAAIEKGLNMLNWAGDVYLKNYGLKIKREMIETKARVLDPPEVQYKNSTARPMYSGRWDLRAKVFFKPNEAPLRSWGIVILPAKGFDKAPTKDQMNAFLKSFITLYQGHGGIVINKNPPIIEGVPDTAKAIETCFSAAGNQVQLRPQMMLIVLPSKNSEVYVRVKKNMDCRWGVMSQCVQSTHVVKNQPQYCSNVLMKFNCKLGGTTCTIKTAKPFFNVPTMIIGADVTHGAPGSAQASIAALTVSMDMTASRYAAGCQTNGYRVEMIQTDVLDTTLKPLIQHWMENISGGRLPRHVYYFRDGVSEAQYGPLMTREVADLKRIFQEKGADKNDMPKFTVVVAEKRHHIRFFPKPGVAADKNQNPVPGVIVDRDVTHPTENDFYLCSHAAIQGTARPTHYYMIMDEMKVPIDEFQRMLYQHCYQYQRATTPVSLFPAVYYAHLAAARAIAHVNQSEIEKWQQKLFKKKHGGVEDSSSKDAELEAPLLMPMENIGKIRYNMWYI